MPNLDLTEAINVVNAKTTRTYQCSKRAEGLKLEIKQAKLTKKDLFEVIQQFVYLCLCLFVKSVWFIIKAVVNTSLM